MRNPDMSNYQLGNGLTLTGCFAGIFAEGETDANFAYFSAETLE